MLQRLQRPLTVEPVPETSQIAADNARWVLTTAKGIVTLWTGSGCTRGSEAILEEESMGRTRVGVAVMFVSAAAVIAASGALAATPQEIYRDYADNGRLDGNYPAGDLEAALKNATAQAYPGPGTSGLKPAVEEESDQPTTSGGTSGGTSSGGTTTGGTAGSTVGGTAGGQASSGAAPVQASGGLPFTGLDLGLIAAGALGLILLGTALRRVARQRA